MEQSSARHARPSKGILSQFPFIRAFRQPADTVTVREPGDRFLSAPQPIAPYAAEHCEFAWLADSAYGKTLAAKRSKTERASLSENPESVLARAGWTQWRNASFLSYELLNRFDAYHLRVEVWERQSPAAVAVSFGGTVFRSKMDWRANLRWFWPRNVDEYTLTQTQFAVAFANECVRRNQLGQPLSACLYSTGHSLGGGLAQQFAYALPNDAGVPRVEKVYAFDPSPVTGFFSVDKEVRDINRASLKIDRIYERGEILAIARSLISFFWRPPDAAPVIRGIRYSLFYSCNPIAGHSMKMMAGKLAAAAGHRASGNGPR